MTVPVVTVEEMRVIDKESGIPESELITRAGRTVGHAARRLLGATYGKRVIVIAGPGNNGADGRVAAQWLNSHGIHTEIVDVDVMNLPEADLIIDAVYGTGFRDEYFAPSANGTLVIAVDIPSGIDGNTGQAHGQPFRADLTVTLGALKPGLLMADGPEYVGEIEFEDLGLDTSSARMALVIDQDVIDWLPERERNAHKWTNAVCVVAGSPGMLGSAYLSSEAAMRMGSGMVRLCIPSAERIEWPAGEVVERTLPETNWESQVADECAKAKALVIGPGLGRSEEIISSIRATLSSVDIPAVVDGDGLFALGGIERARDILSKRTAPAVLTPHDGEYARLAGSFISEDRVEDARRLSKSVGAVVLLKGATTVVASPDGEVLFVANGDQRLATAGTGDVLSGMIGALLAQGVDPLRAAACAAHVHGGAAMLGHERGFVAQDLLSLITIWFSSAGLA